MHCGFGVANGPWGERSPEPVKRHKNSVIIASPFTTSEVPVALAFTLFGLSPKRVKMNWHQSAKLMAPGRQNPRPVGALELWALGSRNNLLRTNFLPCCMNMAIGGPLERPRLRLPRTQRSIPDLVPCANVSLLMARQSTHQTKPNAEKNPRRDPTASGQRDASVNRIASHNYFLLEKFETGVVLTGTEVKSIRAGRANLKDSYGLVKDGELWLLNAHIGPYEHGNIFNHAPLRTRKLLVHKDELRKLVGKTQQKGLTLIPTRMYFKNGKVKVELALAKGKQLWDKRETERRRTADKEARDAIVRGRK